jgi:hypothetical protein
MSNSTSDHAYALRLVKKAHDELMNVLSTPDVIKLVDVDSQESLKTTERVLAELRFGFSEAVGHEITI